jgi:hypothetical protein
MTKNVQIKNQNLHDKNTMLNNSNIFDSMVNCHSCFVLKHISLNQGIVTLTHTATNVTNA